MTKDANVVRFPTCHFHDKHHWYGGVGYATPEDVKDAMSDRDWRRVVQWENRHRGWLKQRVGNKQKQG
jgi:hypothetical protein